MTAEQNYRLLQELDANRRFMPLACRNNPELLAKAEARNKMLFPAKGTDPHTQNLDQKPA